MLSGSANVRYGRIRPIHVLKMPMSDHSLNSGAAIAICGNVEIVSTMPRITNLPRSFSRARAWAQKDPTPSASAGRHERHDGAVAQRLREVGVLEDRLVVV